MKKLFFLLMILLIASPAFASVAVEDNGTYEGEATAINFSTGNNVSFDGSKATVTGSGSPTFTTVTATNVNSTNVTATNGYVTNMGTSSLRMTGGLGGVISNASIHTSSINNTPIGNLTPSTVVGTTISGTTLSGFTDTNSTNGYITNLGTSSLRMTGGLGGVISNASIHTSSINNTPIGNLQTSTIAGTTITGSASITGTTDVVVGRTIILPYYSKETRPASGAHSKGSSILYGGNGDECGNDGTTYTVCVSDGTDWVAV